jgi:exodeoxyribonuclease VII large subunit
VENRRQRLADLSRGLPRKDDLLSLATQRFDHAASRLGAGLHRNVDAHARDLAKVGGALRPGLLDRERQQKAEQLARLWPRMRPLVLRQLEQASDRLGAFEKLRVSYNPDGPLGRGFARVHHADGRLATAAADLAAGEGVKLVFGDGNRSAVVDGTPAEPRPVPVPKAAPKRKPVPPEQGNLF